MSENENDPNPMPTELRLFGAVRKSDAAPIALMEAWDEVAAPTRAAYVLGRLGLAQWDEVELVEVQAIAGPYLRVPTFLDAFFKATLLTSKTH